MSLSIWPQHTVWSPQSCLFPRVVVPCLASPCHACSTTKRSFFSRCHHSPDDVMWWRSATRHVLVATGTSATQIMSPIRFRHCATSGGEQTAHATHATNLSERFPPGHKQNHKNRNAHCTTTRRRKLLRRLCKATFAVTASTRPEHAFLIRQKPSPSRRQQVQRRRRLPHCFHGDRASSGWCSPCNATQQRPHELSPHEQIL